MATRFQAKIKLGNMKRAPVSHTGYRGRVMKKGDVITTTDPDEAAYYRAQPGFMVTVLKGKLTGGKAAAKKQRAPEPPDVDDEESDDEEEERDEEVEGAYEKADLKKMSKGDLKTLIDDDEDLPLTSDDLPKKASKEEIIDAILEAQAGDDEAEDDEEEEAEDDED